MPKIAHISDIHFGGTFDFDIWGKVRTAIVAFAPDIIVASGDFIDNPHPFLLLAAKRELEALCAECPSAPQMFVVPGNHDFLDVGNIWHPTGPYWFDRIMFSDIGKAARKLEASLGFTLGFNSETLKWSRHVRFKGLNPANSIWLNTNSDHCDGRLQSCDRRRAKMKWPIQSRHRQAEIVCFDSNPSALRWSAFATGEVGGGQVIRLGAKSHRSGDRSFPPRAAGGPTRKPATALRIAVLHHHPLPIALPGKSIRGQRTEGKLDPFLILRNSGDLLHKLQQGNFDLVLHGHKHRPQFARIALRADDPAGYPLLVLAAGSTAKNDEEKKDNTLRLIWTEANGRLTVETYEQGERAKDLRYMESLWDFRRRSFEQAVERTGLVADELHSAATIDEVGNLRSCDRTIGLRVPEGGDKVDGLAIGVLLPPYDTRANVGLHEDGKDDVSIRWIDRNGNSHDISEPQPPGGYCWLRFVEPLDARSSRARTFGIKEAASNSIAMTRWELMERSRHGEQLVDPEYEQIGYFVSYPVRKLTIHINIPHALEGVRPEASCVRHPAGPEYPLTFRADDRSMGRLSDFLADADLQKEEGRFLHRDSADRSWTLTIEHPVPGHMYAIRWKVPTTVASKEVRRRTSAFQKLLLQLRGRIASAGQGGALSATDRKCADVFAALFKTLADRFSSEVTPDEQLASFLMVYDTANLMLEPVLTQPDTFAGGPFAVPLGVGVAGAAFRQRRVLAWGDDPDSDSLIGPMPTGLPARRVLALPIYHWREQVPQAFQLDIEPGALIGVVTLGSDAIDSRIADCQEDNNESKSLGQDAQALAQRAVIQILSLLARPKPAAAG